MLVISGLLAFGLWLQAICHLPPWRLWTTHLLGVFLVAGAAFVVIVRCDCQSATATIFATWVAAVLVAGLSFLAVVYRQPEGAVLRRWFWAELISTVGVFSTLWCWNYLEHHKTLQVQQQVQTAAAQFQRQWDDYVKEQTKLMSDFARRGFNLPPPRLQREISHYVATRPECLGVWQLTAGQPPQPLEVHGTVYVSLNDVLQCEELQRLRDQKRLGVVVLPRLLSYGRPMLVAYLPWEGPAASEGLLSVYNLEQSWQQWASQTLGAEFAVTIRQGDTIVFEWQRHARLMRDEWKQTLPLRWGNWQWQATIRPTPEALDQAALLLPHWTLGVGITGSLLLALVTHLALTATARARALEREN
ncbi:MAG: hypothetical protein RMJ88_16755, partial [Thermogemmata sp.]|nr:hypothetical protein [Thermogemmata sp.]